MDNSALLMRGTRKPSPSFFFLLSVSHFFFLNFLGYVIYIPGFPRGAVVKNMPANAGGTGNMGSVPGLGKSPGEGNGNPLQYSCLENPMDREAWWATVHGVSKSQIRLSLHAMKKKEFTYHTIHPFKGYNSIVLRSQSCTSKNTVNFRMFLLPSKQTPYFLAFTPSLPFSYSPDIH